MNSLHEALVALEQALPAASPPDLMAAAAKVRASVPEDDETLVAIAEGLTFVLGMVDDTTDRDVLTSQISNDLDGLRILAGLVDDPTPPPVVEAPPPPTEEPLGEEVVSSDTVRVDLSRVDNLVETIGELVVIDAMVNNSTELAASMPPRARQQLSQLSKIVRDLQRQGLALRMVPLTGLFERMQRRVHDLARRVDKRVRVEISGHEAEMDRSVAERMIEPLGQLLRNATEHGIETAEERVAAGKPEVGIIRLTAYHGGGNIIIELSDDGRGLQRDRILRCAVEAGVVADGAALPDREVWELLFHAEIARQLTAAGVLTPEIDSVKRAVESLRGRVQVSSEQGKGTTYKLVLPLTLAIIDGMLLVVGKRRYVLPTLSIIESIRPTAGQIHTFATGGRLLDIRGAQLPLVDLGMLLSVDAESSSDPTSGFIVVVDGLTGRFALLVDDLIGQQQVVIKQVDPGVNRSGLFSGAAILSDGLVGLILNPAALYGDDRAGRGGGGGGMDMWM